jgi:hypothetical protein
MNGKGIELVLLGYSAAESASIRHALSSLAVTHELALRCIDAVDQLPAVIGDGRQRLVVANERLAEVDVNRVIELCRQHAGTPPPVLVAHGANADFADRVVDARADGQVSGDPLDRLRRIVMQHLRGHRLPLRGVSTYQALSRPFSEHLSSLLDISTDAVIATDHEFNVFFSTRVLNGFSAFPPMRSLGCRRWSCSRRLPSR